MRPFKKILFPVDFSEVSPKIAPDVCDVAETYGAAIHVIFVARMFYYYTEVNVDAASIEAIQGEIVQGAEKKMDDFIKAHFKDYPNVTAKVLIGDPAEEILRYAKSENMGLIIIGTHGRKGLERVLFGSVAERVIKMSPVPVLSINPYRIAGLDG
jgi:nucleotide-binding universal stress UspA family protein